MKFWQEWDVLGCCLPLESPAVGRLDAELSASTVWPEMGSFVYKETSF
jgi:hypothetical protein